MGVTTTLKIICMDGRSFVQESAFETHAQTVHPTGLLFARFEVTTLTDGKVTAVETSVAVPYRTPAAAVKSSDEVDVEVEVDVVDDGVAYADDACEDCLANDSAFRVPVHPSCNCEPIVGWDVHIESLVQPEGASDEFWAEYLAYLDKAKKGRV